MDLNVHFVNNPKVYRGKTQTAVACGPCYHAGPVRLTKKDLSPAGSLIDYLRDGAHPPHTIPARFPVHSGRPKRTRFSIPFIKQK